MEMVPVTCGQSVLLRVGGFDSAQARGILALTCTERSCPTASADLNGDGDVDLNDFALFQREIDGPYVNLGGCRRVPCTERLAGASGILLLHGRMRGRSVLLRGRMGRSLGDDRASEDRRFYIAVISAESVQLSELLCLGPTNRARRRWLAELDMPANRAQVESSLAQVVTAPGRLEGQLV